MKVLLIALAATASQGDLKTEQLVEWRTCLIGEVERYAHFDQPWEIVWKAARSACREWKIKYWLVASRDYERYPKLTAFAKAARDAEDMEQLLENDLTHVFLERRHQ